MQRMTLEKIGSPHGDAQGGTRGGFTQTTPTVGDTLITQTAGKKLQMDGYPRKEIIVGTFAEDLIQLASEEGNSFRSSSYNLSNQRTFAVVEKYREDERRKNRKGTFWCKGALPTTPVTLRCVPNVDTRKATENALHSLFMQLRCLTLSAMDL